MKDTFTIEDIKEIIEKAIEKTKFSEDEDGTISNELNKAWNRGMRSMGNRVLIIANEMKWGEL